jgi:hypothetical protein
MSITAIVQALWVATVFSTALVVGQALTRNSLENQTPALFQSAMTGSFDAAAEAPPGTSITTGDVSIAWPYWQESL